MINLFDSKYKIVADNATDNSAGLQAWANDVCASNGCGYIHGVAKGITFKSPVVFQSQGTTPYCKIRIVADGFAQFNFLGQGNAFVYKGLRNAVISGIGVVLGSAPLIRDTVAHEIQFDAAHGNCANVTFDNLFVDFNGCKNCIGLRIGQDTAGRSSAPWTTIRQSSFVGVKPADGNVGIQIGGSQAYSTLLEQCAGAQLAQYVLNGPIRTALTSAVNSGDTSLPVVDTTLFPATGSVQLGAVVLVYTGKTAASLTGVAVTKAFPAGSSVSQYVPGQGVYSGSGLVTVHAGGGSNNLCDFWQQCNGGTLRLCGTRWETGQRLFQDGGPCATGFVSHLEIDGGYLATYTQGSAPIYVRGNGTVHARGWSVYGNTAPWTAANPLVSLTGIHAALDMERCDVYGTDPFYSGTVPVALRNVQLTDASGHVVGLLNALRNGAC